MIACIEKCREPLRSILSALHSWVMTTYPDTVVSQPDSMDKDGWLHYAVPDMQGGARPFAGARFRLDKPMGVTVLLAAKPEHDPMEWVHADMGKLRTLGFAFGLPRPFEKDVSEEGLRYLFDLVAQARTAVGGSA